MSDGSPGEEPWGATPLDDEDLTGLRPTWVATRADLNAAEQENIEQGVLWLRTTRPDADTLTTVAFADELHRRLFADVWSWAGQHRRRATNVGVDWYLIPEKMQELFANAGCWRANATFSPTEQAVRLHHLLVWIHPYPNGNGRHTRILASTYSLSIGGEALTWGRNQDLVVDGDIRTAYLEALRRADDGDYELLIAFARS